MKFTVYCDGSGTTGGPAGLGWLALTETLELHDERSLPLERATNQQAEILAAAHALHHLPAGSEVIVWSDSQYVVKGWMEWVPAWRERGWRKLTGGVPSNLAYWHRLSDAVDRHAYVEFAWLRGHDGHEHNERADWLAGQARAMAMSAPA